MWIFGTSWFVSVVNNRDKDDELLVRARLPKDLHRFLSLGYPEEAFPTTWTDPKADYRYRASIPRHIVARIAHAAVMEIFYDNFKNEAHRQSNANGEDGKRCSALSDVWQVMFDLQNGGYTRVPFYGRNYAALDRDGYFDDEEPSFSDTPDDHYDDAEEAWLTEEADQYSDYQDSQSFYRAVRQGALDLFSKRSA